MYEPHKSFESPDDNAKIWRYISFPKFLSTIETSSLHFTRVDKFRDKYEGKHSDSVFSDIKPKTDLQKQQVKEFKEKAEQFAKSTIRVNCWNLNDNENSNLWKVYVQNNGVAIQSTFKKLADSFANSSENVCIGKVKYIDHSKDTFPDQNVFHLVIHKEKYYEDEKELRAAIMLGSPGTDYMNLQDPPIVLPVKSDLNTLIENIVLYPGASAWLQDLVDSVLKKYGYKFPVEFSNIQEK